MEIDLKPLYRSASRFDELPRLIEKALPINIHGYDLLYNIELIDINCIRITLAVPGFIKDDIDINIQDETLIIRGKQIPDRGEYYYLYKSISTEDFEIHFKLSSDACVGKISMEHGLLSIDIEREVD